MVLLDLFKFINSYLFSYMLFCSFASCTRQGGKHGTW